MTNQDGRPQRWGSFLLSASSSSLHASLSFLECSFPACASPSFLFSTSFLGIRPLLKSPLSSSFLILLRILCLYTPYYLTTTPRYAASLRSRYNNYYYYYFYDSLLLSVLSCHALPPSSSHPSPSHSASPSLLSALRCQESVPQEGPPCLRLRPGGHGPSSLFVVLPASREPI